MRVSTLIDQFGLSLVAIYAQLRGRAIKMSRGKYFTVFEHEIIKVCVARNVPIPKVAIFLNRNRSAIYKQIEKMKRDGTIDALPFEVVCDFMERQVRAAG
jgi:hypothetical protein